MDTITKSAHLGFITTVAAFLLVAGFTLTSAAPARVSTTRAQAISLVRSILDRNAASCRISRTTSITATEVKAGWRVTAKVVMSANGIARSETAVWTVRTDGEAVAANQLTSEIENGCR